MYHNSPKDYVCPFCLLVSGHYENPVLLTRENDIVYEDDFIMSFICCYQWTNNPGHVLVIPKEHYENIYEIPLNALCRVHEHSKAIALAMKEVYQCDGISTRQHNEAAGNQDVWHYHQHVLPRFRDDNLYNSH